MQHLLSNYHPDVAPLAHQLRAGLEASVTATELRPRTDHPPVDHRPGPRL